MSTLIMVSRQFFDQILTKCIFLIWLYYLNLCEYLNHFWVTYIATYVNPNYAGYGNLWPNFQQNVILLIWLYLLMLCEYLSHL